MNWTNQCLTLPIVAITLATIGFGEAAWGQSKGKGGGGSINYGNVTAWYDEQSNTLFAIGDSNSNQFLVEVRDGSASVLSGMSPTLINGQANRTFDTLIRPEGFTLTINGGAGNDVIEVNVATQITAFAATIEGGDGDDIHQCTRCPCPRRRDWICHW